MFSSHNDFPDETSNVEVKLVSATLWEEIGAAKAERGRIRHDTRSEERILKLEVLGTENWNDIGILV